MKTNLLAAALACVAVPTASQAGTFLEEFLTPAPAAAADASSGISLSKTYTHLVDWNTDDGGAMVNGVTLVAGGNISGPFYTFSGVDNFFQNSANNYDPASGMFDLSEDFLFTSAIGAGVQTLTLTGLTGGTTYTITHYQSQGWQGALQILDGDDDGFGFNTFTTDRGDANFPRALRYTYTQAAGDTDFQMTFDAVNDTDGFHHYAFTNEVVPEPATAGLLALSGIGLLMRRRRA